MATSKLSRRTKKALISRACAPSGPPPAGNFGLEGEVVAYVYPIEVHVRELKRSFMIRDAHFTVLKGLSGILGHHGFLDRVVARFVFGRSFEIDLRGE